MSRVAFMLLALVACKSDAEKVLDKNRDAIVAALGRLKALAPAVDKQPHLSEANWPVAGVKVGENAQLIWANKLSGSCNAMWTTYAPDNTGNDYIMMINLDRSQSWFETPTCAIEGNKELMGGLTQQDVDKLVHMKYALVLRPTVKIAPHIDRGEADASYKSYMETGKGKAIEHFVAGQIAGDALLYELATGKLVGNFPFEATNSEKVEVGGIGYDELAFDLTKQLETHLTTWLAK